MRTTVCLLASLLTACADQPLVDVETPAVDGSDPEICDVLAENLGIEGDALDRSRPAEPFERLLRLPGPRQPRGGIPEPTTPPAPNDPRDYCELTNRCTMRAASSDIAWHGAIIDGELVVGYSDEVGIVRSTIVDAVPPGATAYMMRDDDETADRAVVAIDDGDALRRYRVCVTR